MFYITCGGPTTQREKKNFFLNNNNNINFHYATIKFLRKVFVVFVAAVY